MNRALLSIFALLYALTGAAAQNALLQAGPVAPGHQPQYVNSNTVIDGGGAGGGGPGVNPSELGLTIRSPLNTYPAANAGKGQYFANFCDYDAPITNPSGYHFLCMSPNAQGGGLIAYGAQGGATPLPFQMIVNGNPINFSNTVVFYAQNYGSCSWTPTGNVGPCANLAYAAAAANGGGTVVFPCGLFGFSTKITNHNSGVKTAGCGLGMPVDPSTGLPATTATVLRWVGPQASLGFDIEPASGTQSMTGAGITGIWVDAQSNLTTALRIASVSRSDFDVGVLNRSTIGMDLSTIAGVSSLGSQFNTGSFSEYTPNAPAGAGILFRKDPGSSLDWSLNTLNTIYVHEDNTAGTPMLFAAGDTNTIQQCTLYSQAPNLILNPTDTLPAGLTNGSTTPNFPWRGIVIDEDECAFVIHGLMSGATFVPTAVAGTEGLTSINITTVSTPNFAGTINVSDTTGIVAGEVINVTGGWPTGVPPNAYIDSVHGPTSLNLAQRTVHALPGSLSAVVSWSAVPGQAANGVYTLTYNSSESGYDLVAPATGHSQTNIKPAGGVLTFTDMIIPWITGTPVNGDLFTITFPAQTTGALAFYHVNIGNLYPYPFFEPNITRSGGCYGNDVTPPCVQMALGQSYVTGVSGDGDTAAHGGIIINSAQSTALSNRSVIIGGSLNSHSGVDSAMVGGHGNAIGSTSFFAAAIGGQSNVITGGGVEIGSSCGADAARVGINFTGSGCVNAAGDAQTATLTFHNQSSAAATATQATTNGGAVNPFNCDFIAANTIYGIERVTLLAIDHTAPATNSYTATWNGNGAPLALSRTGAVGTTLLNGSASTIAPDATHTNGTGSTASATIAADTAQGCLKLIFTTPSGNANQWIHTWHVTQLESQ